MGFNLKCLYIFIILSFLHFYCVQTRSLASQFWYYSQNSKHILFFKDLINNFHVVEPKKLYRSKQLSPTDLAQYIKRFGIKTVINLRGESKKDWFKNEKATAEKLDVKLYNIKMSAKFLPQKQALLNLLDLYDKASKPILVHCLGGADRSGEAAALWVLEQQHKNKHQAKKQLSMRYMHFKMRYPAIDFLIRIWNGRQWLEKSYERKNYPKFCPKNS